MIERALAILDRFVAAVLGAAMALALPVSLLLFLQWPLRDLVQAYSREANDIAQLLFALYVAAAISYASRRGVHLAADVVAHRYRAATRTRAGAGCVAVRARAVVAVHPVHGVGRWSCNRSGNSRHSRKPSTPVTS